ncbi:MAG: ABC transporter substrate-binding protein [Deltaproteobacteria bacterium]|nr:ABC transporter substrate-binding protein [Deltaproteobacteria bacterium]
MIDKPVEVNLAGSTLKGTYRVDRKIGEGGFGAVYEGTQLALGRRVAIKTLLPGLERDPSLVTRFFREARLLSQLSHANIVHVYDCGNTEQGVFFLVMELLEGAPLHDVVPPNQGLPFTTALEIFKQICAGVQEAHRVGLVHRDLKPANVFLPRKADASLAVKVLDFGLARHITLDTHITRDGFMLGTPGYAAPEQITATAEPDARSDIYGLGAVLYFMLAGRNPFGGHTAQSIMARQLSAAPDPLPAAPPEVPVPVQAVIFKALEANPQQRFASVAELWQALAAAARGQATGPVVAATAALPVAVPRTAVLPTPAGQNARGVAATALLPNVAPSPPSAAAPTSLGGVEIQSRLKPAVVATKPRGSRRKLLVGGAVAGFGAAGFGMGIKLGLGNREPLRLGISAAFSGPSQLLGRSMHTGIDARLRAAEADGELPRAVQIIALDDGYEPARAKTNVQSLLSTAKVLAVVGNVGTATAEAVLPLILAQKTPFVGAMTGAPLLRKTPPDRYVFNYRASYAQETAAMIDHFVLVRRVPPERIALFTQDDAYGEAGLEGVFAQLRRHNFFATEHLVHAKYERNSLNVSQAVEKIAAQSGRIDAVVMVATYRAAARFIDGLRQRNVEKMFANVSFVNSQALAEELRGLGDVPKETLVTQVVPHPFAEATGVITYRKTLMRFFPEETPGFVSLEGYIVGCLLVDALKRCKRFDREELVDVLEQTKGLDLGLGTSIDFGPSDHEGSERIWGTMLGKDFRFESVDLNA